MNANEVKKWGKLTLMSLAPAVLAFLMALQGGQTVEFAKGAAYQALLAAGIFLTREFIKEG